MCYEYRQFLEFIHQKGGRMHTNQKKLWLTTFVVFVWFYLFDWLFHGMFMKETYMATSQFWRSETEMMSYMPWMVFGHFFLALMFTFIFTKGYEHKGTAEGFRYGFYVSLFFNAPLLIWYAVMPYSLNMTLMWIAANFVKFIVGGLITSKTYTTATA